MIFYKQVTPVATHEKHLTTVVDETPAAPSLVPRPTSQPRQVSPARSLVPTPEGTLFLSCVITHGLWKVSVLSNFDLSSVVQYNERFTRILAVFCLLVRESWLSYIVKYL